MKLDELLTLFGVQLEVFEPIVGQPTDGDITRLWEVLTSLLYPIRYEGDDQKHSLLGIIMSDAAYTGRYTTTFLPPDRVSHYNSNIADDAEGGACAKAESKDNVKKQTTICTYLLAAKRASLSLPSWRTRGFVNYKTRTFFMPRYFHATC